MFVGIGAAQFVGFIEVMIDLEVDLLSCERVRTTQPLVVEREYGFVSILLPPNPAVTRRVQAIADIIVVRLRHHAQELGDETCGIHRGAVCIPGTTLNNRI